MKKVKVVFTPKTKIRYYIISCLFLVLLLSFCFYIRKAGSGFPFKEEIVINSPVEYQTIQRNSENKANIFISGRYEGNPSSIEASWNDSSYVVICKYPEGGRFEGLLTDQNIGQGKLKVRFSDKIQVYSEVGVVSIGDIFVLAGQSNSSGRGIKNQTYEHPYLKAALFGNDDKWKALEDPVDSSVGQVDMVSSDKNFSGGSIWPILAALISKEANVPVAFMPVAKGSSSITEWQRNNSNPDDPSTLYGSMYRRINEIEKVKTVLFWQGETDANRNMAREEYEGYLTNMTNDIYNDFGVETMVAQVGKVSTAKINSLENIRIAQQNTWVKPGHVLSGPSLADINLVDEVHFTTSEELEMAAKKWWEAIGGILYKN